MLHLEVLHRLREANRRLFQKRDVRVHESHEVCVVYPGASDVLRGGLHHTTHRSVQKRKTTKLVQCYANNMLSYINSSHIVALCDGMSDGQSITYIARVSQTYRNTQHHNWKYYLISHMLCFSSILGRVISYCMCYCISYYIQQHIAVSEAQKQLLPHSSHCFRYVSLILK